MAYEDIVSRFKNGTATMMNYGYGTPGSSATTAPGMSPMNLPNARTVKTSPSSFNYPTTMYGRPPEAYNAPTTFPGVNPTANMSPRLVANAPFGFPAPSQAGNNPVGSGGFLYNPNNGFLPIPNTAPTQTAGLNIQPWAPENMSENGNPIAAPPMASAYAPQVTPNPAAAAATAAAGGAPGQPQTSWMQDMITGLNSLMPGAPKPLNSSQSYAATNAAAADRARTQDRSGIGTDGYVRNAAGDVIGRDAKYKGMNSDQMYNAITGRPQDDSWKTIGPSGSDNKRWRDYGFPSESAYKRAMNAYGAENNISEMDLRDQFNDLMRSKMRTGSTSVGGSGPVTAGPMQAPRSGGMSLAAALSGRKAR